MSAILTIESNPYANGGALLVPEGLLIGGEFGQLSELAQGALIELGRQATFLPNGLLSFTLIRAHRERKSVFDLFLEVARDLRDSGLATWVRSVIDGDGNLLTFWAVSWLPYAPLEDFR